MSKRSVVDVGPDQWVALLAELDNPTPGYEPTLQVTVDAATAEQFENGAVILLRSPSTQYGLLARVELDTGPERPVITFTPEMDGVIEL